MARRLTAHLCCSINGVAESPNLWQFDAFGPEEGQMMGRALSGGADVVIGRKLWQEWSQSWPNADASDPFGQFINPVRKHVVSRTLSGPLGWNSAVIDSDPAAYAAQLKQEGSGDILLVGGIETTRSKGEPDDGRACEGGRSVKAREREIVMPGDCRFQQSERIGGLFDERNPRARS